MAIQCNDLEDRWFRIHLGGNGDYYPEFIFRDKDDLINRAQLRICTSGSKISLDVRLAIANLYSALEQHNLNDWPIDI